MEWSQHLTASWFADGSSTTDGTKSKWKTVAYSQGEEMAITEEGPTKSVQNSDRTATLLAIIQTSIASGTMDKLAIIPTATITNKPRGKYIGDLPYHTLDGFQPGYWDHEHFILNLTTPGMHSISICSL